MVTKTLKGTVLTAVGALLASACTPEAVEDALPVEATPTNEAVADPLSCETDLAEIVSLHRSGLPDYDYEPAADLKALIAQSDMVLAGTIDSIIRPPGGTHTVMSMSDPRVLHLGSTLHGEEPELSVISMSSPGVHGADLDRMTVPTGIEGLAFVAFILHSAGPHGGPLVDVQGLVVSCGGADESAKAIVEPLPNDTSGFSVAELVEAVILLEE